MQRLAKAGAGAGAGVDSELWLCASSSGRRGDKGSVGDKQSECVCAEQTTWGALAQQLPQGDLMEIAAIDSSTVCRLLQPPPGAAGSLGLDQGASEDEDSALSAPALDENEKQMHKWLEGKLLDWSRLLVALRTSRLLLVFMRAAVHKFLRRRATSKACLAVACLKRYVRTWQERRRGGKLLLMRVERRMLAKSLQSWTQLRTGAARGFRIARKALRRRLTSLSFLSPHVALLPFKPPSSWPSVSSVWACEAADDARACRLQAGMKKRVLLGWRARASRLAFRLRQVCLRCLLPLLPAAVSRGHGIHAARATSQDLMYA